MWLWLHCVLYAKVITGYIDIACYGTPHIRGERNEDILFRLVTPYAIHEVPLHYRELHPRHTRKAMCSLYNLIYRIPMPGVLSYKVHAETIPYFRHGQFRKTLFSDTDSSTNKHIDFGKRHFVGFPRPVYRGVAAGFKMHSLAGQITSKPCILFARN